MGVDVRVAHRDVDQLHPRLLFQRLDQPDGLRAVEFRRAALLHAKAVRIRKPVVDVEPRGHDEVRARVLPRLERRLADVARAVVKVPAVAPLAREGGEQLAAQIPVAALDIHAVKARFFRKARGAGHRVLRPLDLLVGQNTALARRLPAQQRIGGQRFGLAVGLGIASGVRRLQNEQRRIAVFFYRQIADARGELLIFAQVVLRQPELARVGAPLRQHGAGLRPDQPRAAARKFVVSADRQLPRRAVRRAVAALHRLDHDAVVHFVFSEGQLFLKNRKIVGQRQRRPDRLRRVFQLFRRLIMKHFPRFLPCPFFARCATIRVQ